MNRNDRKEVKRIWIEKQIQKQVWKKQMNFLKMVMRHNVMLRELKK